MHKFAKQLNRVREFLSAPGLLGNRGPSFLIPRGGLCPLWYLYRLGRGNIGDSSNISKVVDAAAVLAEPCN